MQYPNSDIQLIPAFFDEKQATALYQKLLSEISLSQGSVKIFGKNIPEPRLTAWYGDEGKSYTYSNKKNDPLPWTPTLLQVKQRIETSPSVSTLFNSVLINFYRNGNDSMGWHADDEPELGKNPCIVSLNFGTSRRFLFRRKDDKNIKFELELTHGSLLIMQGETQHFWQHALPKQIKKTGERLNLTFRHIY